MTMGQGQAERAAGRTAEAHLKDVDPKKCITDSINKSVHELREMPYLLIPPSSPQAPPGLGMLTRYTTRPVVGSLCDLTRW